MDNSKQLGEFAAGPPPAVASSSANSSPIVTSQDGTQSHHRLANGLVWVLRGLSLCATIWGIMNINNAWKASQVLREFRAMQNIDVQEAVASTAVFGAVVFAAACVAVLLALSEGLRLCIRIEHNTQRSGDAGGR